MLLPPPPVPTAPPASLTSFNITPKSFSIQWDKVPCIHTNGEITGYSVVVHGNGKKQNIYIVGVDVFQTNFAGLAPDTKYLVQVAGVNSKGAGVYNSLAVITPQSQYAHIWK